MYICKVCGYDRLEDQQYTNGSPNFTICPCCGFESGYDDDNLGYSFESYRNKWLENGGKWFKEAYQPENWDIYKQLENLNIDKDE